MKKKRVLIFPAGTEIAFEIRNALKYSKFVELIGGTSADDHSSYVFDELITDIPFVTEQDFVKKLNQVTEEYQIDCIYPAHDSVCVCLSEHKNEIKAQVIITDYKTTEICRSKKQTFQLFKDENFIPVIYETPEEISQYPVFVKPDISQGSRGAYKVLDRKDLEARIHNDTSLIIMEYLPGTEYTIDCFTDGTGKLRIVKMRDRSRIRTGISVRSTMMNPCQDILTMADKINECLDFKGAWFFQVKQNSTGDYKLMEISPRIPGTMGLSRNCGINFPMLTLFVFWGFDVDLIDNQFDISLDRAFYSAYKINNLHFDTVYVDYDDTMVIDRKVNKTLLLFLYQCVEKNKKIILLSKHIGDLFAELAHYKIETSLFDEIIVIGQNEQKSEYVQGQSAIFIDDSFAERKRIFTSHHIPVYDLDMIESLIDWSELL